MVVKVINLIEDFLGKKIEELEVYKINSDEFIICDQDNYYMLSIPETIKLLEEGCKFLEEVRNEIKK